ncbi:MAG: Lrp/AsnC family transcriptional regulator [Dehalococcoidia bacterium]|nr:Lrp/AsnC family transcriptional regulator [Dehalococcoidia bacterium]
MTRDAVIERPEEQEEVAEFDLMDKQILNVIQSAFPMVERPYAALAAQLGLSEDEMMRRLVELRRKNVVRQIGGIFDTRRLGYKSSLVAMQFPAGKVAAGARVVNEHPGVSHNYERNHAYNLWFTVAVPPNSTIEETVARMAERAKPICYRILPTLRFFKVGVNFDMVSGEGNSNKEVIGKAPGTERSAVPLTDEDIRVIREVQEDLELLPEPFAPMAERLGMSQQEMFAKCRVLEEKGLMRRYSAVLHHRRAGFRANAMAVWRVPPERALEAGLKMAESRWVSHCYERPTYEDWPYSHFTMLHARSREECDALARDISKESGISEYLMLYSTREYKKTRVRYFDA